MVCYIRYLDISFVGLSRRKCEPVTAALVASTLASGIGNVISTANTNKTNIRLARENQAWQSKEAEKQRQFSQNQAAISYQNSSPLVNKLRLQEAGLNPFLSDTSQAISQNAPQANTPAVPSAPSLPQVQPLNFDFLSQLVPLLLSAKKTDAESLKLKTDALGSVADTASKIYKTYGKKAGDEFLKMQAPFIKGADYQGSQESRMLEGAIKKVIAEGDYQRTQADLEAEFGRERSQSINNAFHQEYVESVARVGKMAADTQREDKRLAQEIAESAQRIIESVAKAANLNANTRQIEKLTPYLVDSAKYEAEIAGYNAEEQGSINQSRSTLRRVRGSSWYQGLVAINAGLDEAGGNVGSLIKEAIELRLKGQSAGATADLIESKIRHLESSTPRK